MQYVQRFHRQGCTVNMVWIPSHIGIPLNEAADATANEGLMLPHVTIQTPPSLSSLRCKVHRTARSLTSGQHRAEVLRHSPSATWYQLATGLEPPHIPPSMTRQMAAIIHRLRLGFPCYETIQGECRTCEYCDEVTPEPLNHYVLECTATERVRQMGNQRGTTSAAPAVDGAASAADDNGDTSRAAAKLVRRLLGRQDVMEYVMFFPPPR